jgi:hypothetical protein
VHTDRVEQLAVVGERLGRSRGGLTSKIHVPVDWRGLPMSVVLTDIPATLPRLPHWIKRGRPWLTWTTS